MSSSFVQQLDKESLDYFNEVAKRPFSEQAVFVMNAFFEELESQAEFIYQVAWEIIKKVDMRFKNVQYIHLYEESCDLDFDGALHHFELLIKFLEDPKNKAWTADAFKPSHPIDMTAIVRKKELRERVDVNFDGRVSFLEYLLYQYNLSPKDLMSRSVSSGEVNEALEKARLALEEVNKRIRAYEAEKTRLEELAASGTGVKALGAKNLLAQLHASPLADELRKALITAEAAVRLASKGCKSSSTTAGAPKTDGAIWWLQRDLKAKKEKYGK